VVAFLHSGYSSKINLSTEEILGISQEISRDFAPCFSSQVPELVEKIRLSPRELLDIGEEISRDFAPKTSYNNPELVLLPVDPQHLYAYWHLGENRETPPSDDDSRTQLTLRIYPQPDEDEEREAAETASWFDIAIDDSMTQQKVALPETVDETAYSAAIGTCYSDNSFIAFAYSNIVHTPHGQMTWLQDHENTAPCGASKNASGRGISR
jgi:hypothetical protein